MAEAPERYCSACGQDCGQELRPEDLFCSNCGRSVHLTAHLPTPEADVPVPPPQQARRTAASPYPGGASSTQSERRPDEPSGQAPFSIKEMVVLGVGAGVFTLLTTSEWVNFPGKLFFAVLTPMMGTVILSIIKAYLSGAAVGGQRLGILGILTALWRFGALPRETKKSILLSILRRFAGVGLVSSIISVSTVFGVHAIIADSGPPPADGGPPISPASPTPTPTAPPAPPTPTPTPTPTSSAASGY
jgi:hypothetical protein